jgi:ABC-type Mn2+/Zn2+ transport system ATPase subunit
MPAPGERKRLTTAEAIVGPRKVCFMDKISTGLDSATLYSSMKWISLVVVVVRLHRGPTSAWIA